MSLPSPPVIMSPALFPVIVNPSVWLLRLIVEPDAWAITSLILEIFPSVVKVWVPVETSILLVPPPPLMVSLLA